MYVKIGNTWINADRITRVKETIETRPANCWLDLYMADLNRDPVTITDKGEIEAFKKFLHAQCRQQPALKSEPEFKPEAQK